MRLVHSSHSDVGMHRVENEDRELVFVEQARGIFIVSDGMGGHRHGAQAAGRAAFAFLGALVANATPSDAAKAADAAVLSIEGKFSDRSPGATLTALIMTNQDAQIVHAGDSEAWRLTADGEFTKLTKDHSSGWGLDNFCGLGQTFDGFKVDVSQMPCRVGDRYLLATDGLTKHVEVLP